MRTEPLIALLVAILFCSTLSAQQPPPARVNVKPVVAAEADTKRRMTGLVDFDRISAVSSEISGLIVEQSARQGIQVEKGAQLVKLNSDLILKDMDIKQKQIAQASSDIDKIGRTLKRLEQLLEKNSASRQAYDDARFDYRSLIKRRETLEQEMERLKLQLEKSTVKAPFSGIILEKLKEQGEWLNPGDSICRIASTQDTIVTVAVSESLIPYQIPGTEVPVYIPALDKKLTGSIQSVAPIANKRSRSVTVKIGIPYEIGLYQNLTAEVEIQAGIKEPLLWIPRDAVVRRQDKEFVYLVEDAKAVMVPIQVQTREAERIGIKNGRMKADTLVVVGGNDRLRPNQPVQIIE